MVKMICKVPHAYGGKDYKEGDEIEVEDPHVVVQEFLQRAVRLHVTEVSGVARVSGGVIGNTAVGGHGARSTRRPGARR